MSDAQDPLPRATLFVVATPIGNLDDLTFRAVKVLRACDAVLAEDTRRTRGLLTHLGLSKTLHRLDAHASEGTIGHFAREIAEGATYAIVSDAGTPVVSDPGADLVRAVLARGASVVAIPGPSAVLCALAASGLAQNAFRFLGFLPRAGGERADAIARVIDTPEPVVLFEAGNRTKATIVDLAARAPTRGASVGRELTKLHEEHLRGTLAELAESLPDELLGEITIVLGAAPAREERIDDAAIDARIDAELAQGRSARDAADVVAAWSGLPRRDIYARVVAKRRR
jgi:16S rRNA (cytidine1402-2'-O)-methyltransferase